MSTDFIKKAELNVPYINKRLVVFSAVEHHPTKTGYIAHGGFVREIDIWARIFEQVLVVTRLGFGPVLSDEVPYTAGNISVICLPAPASTDGMHGKIKLFLYLPFWFYRSLKLLSTMDVVMARGPESIGFLGWLVTRFKRLPHFAKYVNQWDDYQNEPIGYRLQKKIYRDGNFGGPVMIYGTADEHRPHLIPFFPIGISQSEWERAGVQLKQRVPPPPFHLLFVGRFVYIKGVDILLDALNILNGQRDDLIVDIVGDGPLRPAIEEKIAHYDFSNVHLHGWLGSNDITRFYRQAHLLIHPSRIEGFGKVLVEAMNYGLPIVGADLGVSKEFVEKNRCGVLFQNGDALNLATQINYILSSRLSMQEFGDNGRIISSELVQERLEQRYRQFISERLLLP